MRIFYYVHQQQFKDMLDGIVGKWIGSNFAIELKEAAKIYCANLFPQTHWKDQKKTLQKFQIYKTCY